MKKTKIHFHGLKNVQSLKYMYGRFLNDIFTLGTRLQITFFHIQCTELVILTSLILPVYHNVRWYYHPVFI